MMTPNFIALLDGRDLPQSSTRAKWIGMVEASAQIYFLSQSHKQATRLQCQPLVRHGLQGLALSLTTRPTHLRHCDRRTDNMLLVWFHLAIVRFLDTRKR